MAVTRYADLMPIRTGSVQRTRTRAKRAGSQTSGLTMLAHAQCPFKRKSRRVVRPLVVVVVSAHYTSKRVRYFVNTVGALARSRS